MIEIGRDYRLVTLKLCDEGYDTESITVTVTGREGNLLQVNGCEVINLASPLVHALIDEQERAAFYKRKHDEFLSTLSADDRNL